jgi:DNA-binding response OmpR family regulator
MDSPMSPRCEMSSPVPARSLESIVRPRHVLLVDDTADNRELYAYYLMSEGFRVTQAAAGLEALREVERDPPDVVVIDIGLPDISGLEVCRRIKAQPSLKDTPILAFTTWPPADARLDRATEAGPDALLILPFLPEILLARIRTVLEVPSASAPVV